MKESTYLGHVFGRWDKKGKASLNKQGSVLPANVTASLNKHGSVLRANDM